MKVLWLCNVMVPMIAEEMNLEATNKEGWISGLLDVVLKKQQENGLELSVAFPAPKIMFTADHDICMRVIYREGATLTCYGFHEQTGHAEVYDESLEEKMRKILDAAKPDIVHCFGTEYPHTLAMARICPDKSRLLIGLQGICSLCAEAYFANIPENVIRKVTLRDYLRRDSLAKQQQKFVKRGVAEMEAITLAGNITGRTEWDRLCTRKWNQTARYFTMNEILRPEFYQEVRWEADKCIPHSVFVSQGDYPLKGLHYMLLAMPVILSQYPDATLYVAGNSIVNYKTLKQKLKISGYGKYLRKLMEENNLSHKVKFMGRLTAEQMRETYLNSSVFVCCSSLENSPNSLGEAMLLGMPCVSADVGGVSSLFADGEDGILYEGFRIGEKLKGVENQEEENARQLKTVSERLAGAVISMWKDPEKQAQYCQNAREHARRTHDREKNYLKLTEIYAKIVSGKQPEDEKEVL